jgi:hypothetical protein
LQNLNQNYRSNEKFIRGELKKAQSIKKFTTQKPKNFFASKNHNPKLQKFIQKLQIQPKPSKNL